jgi:hypothetical protein
MDPAAGTTNTNKGTSSTSSQPPRTEQQLAHDRAAFLAAAGGATQETASTSVHTAPHTPQPSAFLSPTTALAPRDGRTSSTHTRRSSANSHDNSGAVSTGSRSRVEDTDPERQGNQHRRRRRADATEQVAGLQNSGFERTVRVYEPGVPPTQRAESSTGSDFVDPALGTDAIRMSPAPSSDHAADADLSAALQTHTEEALGPIMQLLDRGQVIIKNDGTSLTKAWLKNAAILAGRVGGIVTLTTLAREVSGFVVANASPETKEKIAIAGATITAFGICAVAGNRVWNQTASARGLVADAAMLTALLGAVAYSHQSGELPNLGPGVTRAVVYGVTRLFSELFARTSVNFGDPTPLEHDFLITGQNTVYFGNQVGVNVGQLAHGASSGPAQAALGASLSEARAPMAAYSAVNGVGEFIQGLVAASAATFTSGIEGQRVENPSLRQRALAALGTRLQLTVGWPQVNGRPATYQQFIGKLLEGAQGSALARVSALVTLYAASPGINRNLSAAGGDTRTVSDVSASTAAALLFAALVAFGEFRGRERDRPRTAATPSQLPPPRQQPAPDQTQSPRTLTPYDDNAGAGPSRLTDTATDTHVAPTAEEQRAADQTLQSLAAVMDNAIREHSPPREEDRPAHA